MLSALCSVCSFLEGRAELPLSSQAQRQSGRVSQEPSLGLALHPGDQGQLGFSSQGTGWCWASSGHGDTHIGVISHFRDFGAFSDDPSSF